MKFRSILAATTLAAACCAPLAVQAQPQDQPPSVAADPERLALAKQMLQEMDLTNTMHGMFSKMFSSMPMPQTKDFDGAQYVRSVGAGVDAVMPDIVDSSAQAYADTFTADELKQYVAFYASPAGQALLKKLPELTQRSMPAIMALMPKMTAAADVDYCAHVTCDAVVKQIFKKQEEMIADMVAKQAQARK